MLQEKLKKAKRLQKCKRILLFLFVIGAVLFFAYFIPLMQFEKLWLNSFLDFLFAGLGLVFTVLLVLLCLVFILLRFDQCSDLSLEIEVLNKKIAFPKDWIHDVDIKVCCASDLILQKEIQNMRIRYLQDYDAIELRFQYEEKDHFYLLEYDFAKECLVCEYLDL